MASSSRSTFSMDELAAVVDIEEENLEEIVYAEEENDDGVDTRWCLVGRLLSPRNYDFNVMKHQLAALWKPNMGMFAKELQPNPFIFQFYHEIDIQRVIGGSPWTFNRMQLVFECLQKGDDPRCMDLNRLDMWVQVYGLEPGSISLKVAKDIGNSLGEFLASDKNNFIGVWHEYVRIRVRFNIKKPLRRRMKIRVGGKEPYFVTFKYERLPTFCYICGIIGHSKKYCQQLFEKPIEQISKTYGACLRADSIGRNKKIGAPWLRSEGWKLEISNVRKRNVGEEDRFLPVGDRRSSFRQEAH